ncbi:TrkA C-terminal domain-containing protein [Glaciimonas sp. Cout2]
MQALRRGKSHLVPEGMQVLQGGDVLVLRGTSEAVARGEQRLLK